MTHRRAPRAVTPPPTRRQRGRFRGCNAWLVFACLVVCLAATVVWQLQSVTPTDPGDASKSRWNPLQYTTLRTDPRLRPPGMSLIVGAPTISADRIDEILRVYGSPAQGTGALWVAEGIAYGIDPVYALAFFMHESNLATNPEWSGIKEDGSTTHNVGNIICAGYSRCHGRFRDYPDWEAGIHDWYRLISEEYIVARGLDTVEGIVPVYAPESENDVSAYIESVRWYAQQWSTP